MLFLNLYSVPLLYCEINFSALRVWPLCKILIDCPYHGGGEFMVHFSLVKRLFNLHLYYKLAVTNIYVDLLGSIYSKHHDADRISCGFDTGHGCLYLRSCWQQLTEKTSVAILMLWSKTLCLLELRANGVIEDGIGLEIPKYQYHFNLINQSGSFMFSGPC